MDSEGNLFLVDSLNGRVRKVGGDGVITTVFHGSDMTSAGAHHYPARVAVDASGNLLIADPFEHRVVTIAGVAAPG